MNEHPILGQLVLGYCPLIDRQRAVLATRLTAFALRPDACPDVAALLQALDEVWPAANNQQLLLNLTSEAMLGAALQQPLPPPVWLELPAFMAADARHAPALARQRKAWRASSASCIRACAARRSSRPASSAAQPGCWVGRSTSRWRSVRARRWRRTWR